MGAVPITGPGGDVNFGAAVPVSVPDYTDNILAGMRQQQAQEDEIIKDQIKQRRALDAKRAKVREDFNRFVFTGEKNLLPIREEGMKALVASADRYLTEKARDRNWDPGSDNEYSKMLGEIQGARLKWGNELKNYEQSAKIPLDDKNQGKYDVNHDYFEAAMGKDPVVAAKLLAKFNTGDESKWEAYDAAGYLGVGALKAKDVTPWDANTIKYVNSIKLPQKATDIGGGKIRTVEGLSAEEIQKAADDFMMGEGGKNAQSLSDQQKANQPSFSIDEGQKIVRNMFVDRLTQRVKDNLKGGQPRITSGEKIEENLFFSPYSSKGADGGAPGFNVGFKGSNKGLKADLQYGKEVLKDVDLKTIYKTDDGKLKAIVMQYDYEERPMTDDEKKKEQQSASVQMREPVFTKTVRSEKPKEVEFSVGSNNYNTIIAQYPGVETKITELIETTSAKPAAKAPAKAKGTGKSWTYGGVTLPESEWISAGWTIEKLKKHAK